MKLEYGLAACQRDLSSIVTVGSFDGVHAGHQAVLAYVIRRAAALRACSTVLTFEPHPREVLSGRPMPLLTTIEEKATILESLGLCRLIVVEFTRDFAALVPQEYVRRILAGRIGLKEIVVGHNHGFGRNRGGDVDLLRHMGPELGFSVDVLPHEFVGAHKVSSRLIRTLIADEGDMRTAHTLLTRPFAFKGRVQRGAGRGRLIGYPTANLEMLSRSKVIPKTGVYVVKALLEGLVFDGMMNIGYRPTVSDGQQLHLEVHLFDFGKSIYGQMLEVRFLHRLRDEIRFSSVAELTRQLTQDAREARAFLASRELSADSAIASI